MWYLRGWIRRSLVHDLVLRSLVQLVAEARSAPSLSTIPGVPFSVPARLDRLYSFRQGWRCADGLSKYRLVTDELCRNCHLVSVECDRGTVTARSRVLI